MPIVATKNPYTLFIVNDENAQNPREDRDNLGEMICFCKRRNIGDEHQYNDKDELLHSLLEDTLKSNEDIEEVIDNIKNKLNSNMYKSCEAYNKAVDDEIINSIRQKYVILPLYIYEHSGMTINTTGFSCPWDSGQVGWIYASHDEVKKEYNTLDKQSLEKALEVLKAEVKLYDSYISKECYGFKLYKYKDEIDSCYGFVGEISDVKEAVREHLPDDCKDMVDCLKYAYHDIGEFIQVERNNEKEVDEEI